MRPFIAFRSCIICLFLIVNSTWSYSQITSSRIAAFDSIFKTAVNSPAYVVASKSDIEVLKSTLKKERDSLTIKLQSQEKELSQLKLSSTPVAQSTPVEVADSPQPVSTSSSTNYLLFQLIIALLVGVIIYFFMKDFSIKKEVREAKDSYQNLVVDFETHKQKAIERERKLMRKVIDLQNDLEQKSNPTVWSLEVLSHLR